VLDKNEEKKLATILVEIEKEEKGEIAFFLYDLTKTTKWLAEKVKELNDELKLANDMINILNDATGS
jgi:hypothetical protein